MAGARAEAPLDEKALETIRRRARRPGRDLVVLFGSAARGAPDARDLDIAVQPPPGRFPDLMTEAAWLADLEAALPGRCVDLLVLTDATDPVVRYEALWKGRLLHERAPGLLDREPSRAFFLYADSAKFRRARRETLAAAAAGWGRRSGS